MVRLSYRRPPAARASAAVPVALVGAWARSVSWAAALSRLTVLSLALAATGGSVAVAQAPASTLPTGERHAVGYVASYVRDATRTFFPERDFRGRPLGEDRRRPVPLRIWYPAVAGTGRPMRYADYLSIPADSTGMRAVEATYAHRNRSVHEFALRTYAPGSDPSWLRRLYASRVAVRLSATPAVGSFPVILFGGGASHSVDENVVLWEHLASRGYVVAVVPAQSRDSADFTPDAAGMEALTRDMEVAHAHVRELPYADRDRVGAMGFSYGGTAALLLAMRNSDIDAVAGWDSSLTAERFNAGLRASPDYDPGRLTAPLLDLRGTRAGETPDHQVLNALVHSDRRTFGIPDAEHIDFNSYSTLFHSLGLAGSPERGRSLADRARLYRALVERTADFFDVYLRQERAGGVDAPLAIDGVTLAQVTRLPRRPRPATYEELAQLIGSEGLAPAADLLPRVGAAADERVAALITISSVGSRLLQLGHMREAIAVHQLNARRYPEYLGPLMSLADAFRTAGDLRCMAATYRRVVLFVRAKGEAATETDRARRTHAERSLLELARTGSAPHGRAMDCLGSLGSTRR